MPLCVRSPGRPLTLMDKEHNLTLSSCPHTLIWYLFCKNLKCKHTKCIDIRIPSKEIVDVNVLFFGKQFRSHIRRGAYTEFSGESCLTDHLCAAKVSQTSISVIVNKYIARLQVTVDNIERM